MNKMLNRAVFFLALILISIALTGKVHAAGSAEPTTTPSQETKGGISIYGGAPIYGGQPVYGGGVIVPKEGEIIVDKMVKNPSTGSFVDHLGPTDPKYRPLNIVTFQIKVNNPGDSTLDQVEVTDTLPDFADFMTGPGIYDQNSRKLRFFVKGLEGGETENFEIKARVSHQSSFPEDKSVVCPVNVVEARMGEKNDRDESQFCIEKEIEVPQVPQAGAETAVLALLGSALSTGLYLRKKTFKS